MRAVRKALWVGCAAILAVVGACTFDVDPDGAPLFSCDTAEDCGKGYECRPQAERERGLCYPLGACADNEESCDGRDDDCNGVIDDVSWAGAACDTAKPGLCAKGHRVCTDGVAACAQDAAATEEVCNDFDDDCDGAADDGLDLGSDNQNCGACGHACASGTTCTFGICAELDCANGVDDDGDGLSDCEDGDCLGRACSGDEPTFVCGLLPPLPGDPDAGDPDGGMGDGGELDAGGFDGGDLDAGDLDAGVFDAGDLDAGDPDAGMFDAGMSDAGDPDAGELDAGTPIPQCVPPELDCTNGLDDDGDGLVDCADPGCDLQPCGDGGTCSQQMCQ